MAKVNFEEKTYETYFNIELASRSRILFPPGQVQEGVLGFDVSTITFNRKLWRMLGYPFWFVPPYEGIELREIADEMERFLSRVIRDIPTMKANILFQYKKPEFIKIAFGAEWGHWRRPYFRYNIYTHQQDMLMRIHQKFGNKVLIIYAAPAISDINELTEAYRDRQIIKKSNFKKVTEINSHHRNTYVESGTYSIACSEPERIQNFDIVEEIEKFTQSALEGSELDNYNYNRRFIIEFRKQIETIILENNFLSNSFKILNSSIEDLSKYELFYSFCVMSNYRLLTGNQWAIKI